jgi:hypothetical protein
LSNRASQFVDLHEVLRAASIAARTSGRSTEPPMMVNVPRQLMIGSTPIDW